MIISYYSDDSDAESAASKAATSEIEARSSTTSLDRERDGFTSGTDSVEFHNNENGSDVGSESIDDDNESDTSDISGVYNTVAYPEPLIVEDDDIESCSYCQGKVNREECKICSCGLVSCNICYDIVFRCGYLCEYTCEHCCDRGVYCSRQAILQCERCSVDHRQRCGCDCINLSDESSDDEEYRACDYCNVEHVLHSYKRCACGVYCCIDCFPKIEKCGYACDFTCEDCCNGVYCSRGGYMQCKLCAADHTERCGCNDSCDGTEASSEQSRELVSQDNNSEEESEDDENSSLLDDLIF